MRYSNTEPPTAPHWRDQIGATRTMETPLGLGLERLLGTTSETACPVARLLAKLETEESTLLTRVLGSNASTRQIHNELTASGHRIGRDTLANHRRGWCRCQGGQL